MKSRTTHSDTIRQRVRDNYGRIADAFTACCGTAEGLRNDASVGQTMQRLGYSRSQIDAVPDAAGMGLGCGNPQAIANLKPGETVLDLGSGAGFDCLLAAEAVGRNGRVIGVDMTDGMIRKARHNAEKAGVRNVEFRIGEIERLPVDDRTIDVIISNCVVNLSPEKASVFREAYRVLKPGGRLAISDVVAHRPLPESLAGDEQMHCACIGGAALIGDLQRTLEAVGFDRIVITPLTGSAEMIGQWVPGANVQDFVVSALIEAVKPWADRNP